MCFVSFKPSKNCIFQGKLNCLITYPFALIQELIPSPEQTIYGQNTIMVLCLCLECSVLL